MYLPCTRYTKYFGSGRSASRMCLVKELPGVNVCTCVLVDRPCAEVLTVCCAKGPRPPRVMSRQVAACLACFPCCVPPFMACMACLQVVHKHRLSADLLAQLSDKVRAAATAAFEREDRALRSLERDLADREARISAREKVLGERETRVSGANVSLPPAVCS